MEFIWDEAKNLANQAKHNVSFTEASVLFTSASDYLEVYDDLHSDEEDRFIAIGPIQRGVVLVVWTEEDDDRTRIITARWATKRERAYYQTFMEQQ